MQQVNMKKKTVMLISKFSRGFIREQGAGSREQNIHIFMGAIHIDQSICNHINHGRPSQEGKIPIMESN